MSVFAKPQHLLSNILK